MITTNTKEYIPMANDAYNQLLQEYVNAPYDVLLAVATEALNKVMPVFSEIAEDGNGASIVLPFICTTLAVDGKFTELEYKFIKDVTGLELSYDELRNLVQQFYSAEWINAVDNLIDNCPNEVKQSLLSFCLAFVSVDEHISREENAFIAKLMA